MIHFDRINGAGPFPPMHWEEKVHGEMLRAEKFFLESDAPDRHGRYQFNSDLWREIKGLLFEGLDGKCVYCETRSVDQIGLDIEHFRPKIEAQSLDRKSDPDWYWWLAYEWENIYLACRQCNTNKRNFFPVLGERARPMTTGKELRKEKALLLDPGFDHPELFLGFDESGLVFTKRHSDPAELERFGDQDRGEITIKLLGLNRPDLVKARAKEALGLRNSFELVLFSLTGRAAGTALAKLTDEEYKQYIKDFFRSSEQYAGMRRQLLARWIKEEGDNPNLSPRAARVLRAVAEEMGLEFGPLRRGDEAAAPQAVAAPEVVGDSRASYIQKVSISNFKAIRNIELTFTPAQADGGAGWKMLLGENAAGKSTVLKAVALALMGEHYVKRLMKADPLFLEKLLNRSASRGHVRVQLFSDLNPIEFSFTKKSLKFKSGGEGANIFVRAYGATRLLPRELPATPTGEGPGAPADDIEGSGALKKVDNLFDPYSTLRDPNGWLADTELVDEKAFASAELALKDLLRLKTERPLSRPGGQVLLDVGDGPLPLEDQSAGYQSVLALAADIMAGLPGSIHDKQQAEGIVLLDEIDAHLHPRWKMEIVSSLRRAFKGIQFLVTTHEPLCLRGLGENEIAVMQRDRGTIVVLDNLPSPVGLRVDQLLTSELFGLYSTIDPEVEREFVEYYELLGRDGLGAEESKRRDDLKEKLERYNVLGYTRRDQLIYEIIDKYLAKEPTIPSLKRRNRLREQTKRRVASIWKRVNDRREVNS